MPLLNPIEEDDIEPCCACALFHSFKCSAVVTPQVTEMHHFIHGMVK